MKYKKIYCKDCGKLLHKMAYYHKTRLCYKCYYKLLNKKIKIKCNTCNKIIYIQCSQIKKFKHHFCSKKCYGIFRSKYYINKNHHLYNSKKLKCNFCNNTIFVAFSRFKKFKHYFCSRKCYGNWKKKNILGDKNPSYIDGRASKKYTINFIEKREYIRFRDDYKCQECGVPEIEFTKKLDIHHIDHDRNNNSEYNLITLCNKCNLNAELKRYYSSYIIKYRKIIKEKYKNFNLTFKKYKDI